MALQGIVSIGMMRLGSRGKGKDLWKDGRSA